MKGDELEERVRKYVHWVVKVACSIPAQRGGAHVAEQMLRAATNARAHYAEARSSESPADFIHKLSLALKEFRELYTWIDDAREAGMISREIGDELEQECDELIAIFCASRATAKRNLARKEEERRTRKKRK